MALTVTVQVPHPGTAITVFNIYYDAVTVPNLLAANVPVASVTAGYTLTTVPDSATYIVLVGDCGTIAFTAISSNTNSHTYRALRI